jgi:hypothetical protein
VKEFSKVDIPEDAGPHSIKEAYGIDPFDAAQHPHGVTLARSLSNIQAHNRYNASIQLLRGTSNEVRPFVAASLAQKASPPYTDCKL